MLIQLNDAERERQFDICLDLGCVELLDQLTEECGELIQAAQKVRRSIKGTTPVSSETALENLNEECADVSLCIDTLARLGLVNGEKVQEIGRFKNGRWYLRVVKEKKR